MSTDDRVEAKMRELAARTAPLRLPSGLEARVLARLARATPFTWVDLAWTGLRRAVPVAVVAAAVAVVFALIENHALVDSVSRSRDAGFGFETRDP